jgi:PTS system beta-glucosides-specific IIC component
LHAPVKGQLEDISKVADPTFASGVMGKGIAIVPSEGKIFAPEDGVVTAIFDTHHAIGLHLNNDADVLIHVGIDTVEMKGKGFKQLVQKGDKVTAGQELLDFNIDEIKKNGYDPTVVMIVTNSKDFLEVLTVLKDKDATKEVTNQDNVIILA